MRSAQAIRTREREGNLVELKAKYALEKREIKEKLAVAEANLKECEDAKPMAYDEEFHVWKLEHDDASDALVSAKRDFRMAWWKWREAEECGKDGKETEFEKKEYGYLWEHVPTWVKNPREPIKMYGMERTWNFPEQYEEMHGNVVDFAR